jgi:kynureninase
MPMNTLEEAFIYAAELDNKDELRKYRNEFFETKGVIYLDGNSLGKLPKKTKERLQKAIDYEWGERMIRSWNESWLEMQGHLQEKIASVVGAKPHEIFLGDNTSIHLYKLAFAALKSRPERRKVVIDEHNFPTDHYILQGMQKDHFPNLDIKIISGGIYGEASNEAIENLIDAETNFICLSHVLYKSGFLYDIKQIQSLLKKDDVLSLWDLSHSVGALPIHLNDWGVDMAVGCTYKYLNGGPGAPAFLYVREDLHIQLKNPINAWFSHANPFSFSSVYHQSESINKFASGTPSILSMIAIEGGLDLILDAGLERIRTKSLSITNLIIELAKIHLEPLGFVVITPQDDRRGSHISLSHPEAYRICQAMISPLEDTLPCVIPDFRPPSYIRLGVAPLYISYTEIVQAIEIIKEIVIRKDFERFNHVIVGVS